MDTRITITQQQSFLDYYRLTWKVLMKIRILWIVTLLIFSMGLLTTLLSFLTGSNSDIISLLSQAIFSTFTIIFIWGTLALLVVIVSRIAKPFLFKPITYHFNHWGLHLEGNNYSANLPWKQFSNTETTKNDFILYEAKFPSVIILKKNFSNAEDLKAFEILLENSLLN